jgi:hypothetical protein
MVGLCHAWGDKKYKKIYILLGEHKEIRPFGRPGHKVEVTIEL